MFELLKILIEKVFPTIDVRQIANDAKASQHQDVGIALFNLYLSLNNICVRGERIISELERNIEWAEGKNNSGEKERKGLMVSFPEMNQQLLDLRRAVYALYRMYGPMAVISSETYEILTIFIYNKSSLLNQATADTHRGHVSIDSMFFPVPQSAIQDAIYQRVPGRHARLPWFSYLMRVPPGTPRSELHRYETPSLEDYPVAEVGVLKALLAERNPRQALKDIKPVLEKLRSDILANFDAKDLIIKVADPAWVDPRLGIEMH